MKKMIPLKEACYYSKERLNIKKAILNNYVTTDNLLPNKNGLATAISLPPQGNSIPHYSPGDILVANIRPYLKKIWFADRFGGCSADVLVFKVKKDYHPKFIFYSMFRDDFFLHTMKGSKGTKMPRGDKNQIMDFLIPDFEKNIQQKIASVLSSLDAKIEINNRINVELEAMAKTLYDFWFLQFDFPNEQGKPYKSSGGKMLYNKELKREIPEGWEVKKLHEIANITMGQSPNGSSYNEEGIGTIFFQGSTDFGRRFPMIRKYTTEPGRFAKVGDILLSVRAPVGTLNIADNDCCIGRGLAALNSKNGYTSYLYYVMEYFKKVFDYRNNSGTTFGSINKDDLHSLKLVYPSDGVLKKFNSIVANFNKLILKNQQQNQQLASLRDWLLPMLMNGQVTVGGAGKKMYLPKEEAWNVAAEPGN